MKNWWRHFSVKNVGTVSELHRLSKAMLLVQICEIWSINFRLTLAMRICARIFRTHSGNKWEYLEACHSNQIAQRILCEFWCISIVWYPQFANPWKYLKSLTASLSWTLWLECKSERRPPTKTTERAHIASPHSIILWFRLKSLINFPLFESVSEQKLLTNRISRFPRTALQCCWIMFKSKTDDVYASQNDKSSAYFWVLCIKMQSE